MRKLCMVLIAVFTLITAVSGQNLYGLSGKVSDTDGLILPGASVVLSPGKTGTVTDANGNFHFTELKARAYVVYVSFVGYKPFSDTIDISTSQNIYVKMQPSIMTLHEVVVADNYAQTKNREDSRNVEVVNDRFVKMNLSGSLMKSLERIPGVSTIGIGSGQSKPVIRQAV